MKVLDLQCRQFHVFEGWFGSEDDFSSQHERGLVSCPTCGDTVIVKRLSAPRLNLGHARQEASTQNSAPTSPSGLAALPQHREPQPSALDVQAVLQAVVQHIAANTVDVGSRFAEEARKMHYGEAQERAIRGQATPEQAEALLDEGIAVMALPLPNALKGQLH